jgi:hypothetical protein
MCLLFLLLVVAWGTTSSALGGAGASFEGIASLQKSWVPLLVSLPFFLSGLGVSSLSLQLFQAFFGSGETSAAGGVFFLFFRLGGWRC